MSELLEEIAGYLVGQVPTLTMGLNLFAAGFVDETEETPADPQVALFEPPGSAPWRTMGFVLPPVEAPRLQVMTRSADYQTGRDLAKAVWRALAGIGPATLSGVRYLDLAPVGSPFDAGRDEMARYLIASNWDVAKELSP